MLPSVRNLYPAPETIYFVHDNCSIHTSHAVKNWIGQLDNFVVLDWPSNSPDLNPIENVWSRMGVIWDNTTVRNRQNITNKSLAKWEELRENPDSYRNSCLSMPRRLTAVLDAGGAVTKY